MVFIYSTTGIFIAEKYDAAAQPADSEDAGKFGNVLKLEFDATTKEIQLKASNMTGSTQKPVADGDIGEGPPLLESELVEKLARYCVLKNEPGGTSGQTVNGNLGVSGNVLCTQVLATSDARLKSNIEEVDGAVLSGLRSYRYTLAGKDRYGIMAQEARRTPGLEILVHEENGALSVDYNGLVALLLAKVNTLEMELEKLKCN